VSLIYTELNLNTKDGLHKGSWLIAKVLSAARKEAVTTGCCVCATGTFVPSAIEFQGKLFNTELQ